MSTEISHELCEFRQEPSTCLLETGSAPSIPQLRDHQAWFFRIHPIVWDNLILVVIGVAYISAIYGVHAIFGIHDKLILIIYNPWFVRMAILLSAFYFLYHIWKKSYRVFLTSRYLIGFLTVFALMPIFKSAFASYKQTIHLIHPFTWDFALMRLDYLLHLGHHPWRLLEPILAFPSLVRAIDFVYMTWFYVLFLSCLWIAWTPRRHLRLCYLLSSLLVWILIGSVMATFLSSAGPCFYSHIVSMSDNPFAPLMKRLNEISRESNSRYLHALFNQAGLWEGKITDTWGPFGGISAMPSIHVAMATLYAWLGFAIRRWLGWVFVAYTAAILLGSVILGWHYAVDGYAGIILASLIWLGVKRIVYQTAPKDA